jgi:hypothetical protein
MYIASAQKGGTSLKLGKDQAGVRAAKAKAVGQGDVDLLFLALVAYKVKVGANVGAGEVQCRWDDILTKLARHIITKVKGHHLHR